jgi:glycosyltransferase involved in cell wall biosynthesis
MKLNWIVSQIGARQHFGVPRGFLQKDELRLLYTEAWCRTGHSLLKRGPKVFRAFAGRYHPDLPVSKVVSFNLSTLYDRSLQKPRVNDIVSEYLYHARFGKAFSTRVAEDLARRELDPRQDLFFGFNTGCLETIHMLAQRGITTVVDQIDPARVEEQLIFEESERWPGWQKLPGRIPSLYWERMDAEWAAASMVLVNSNWSRKALITQGVAAEKIIIIPPPYEPEKIRLPARRNFEQPITVLWLGLVNLRKGIQYLIHAARLLQQNSRIRFIIAGPIQISEQAVRTAPPNMQFLGKIPRSETAELFRSADVFVLPTLSDGFAVAQLEAMSQALPVITTPNCGDVVTDGVDGLIVPPSDPQALAAAIQHLDDDRKLLREMSYAALNKSTYFYLPRQAELLDEAIQNLRAGRQLEKTRFQTLPDESAIRLNSSLFSGNLPELRVAVVQDGARLHYAVPLALNRLGALRVMLTEVFLKRGPRSDLFTAIAGKSSSKRVNAMLQRRCDEIAPHLIRTNPLLAARQFWNRNRRGSEEGFYEWSSRAAGRWILRQGIADANVLFGFIRNIDPDVCRQARQRGVLVIGDQMIAPAVIEAAEAQIQKQRWPDWINPQREPDYQIVQQAEKLTWRHLNLITCGSSYVRDGLIAQGLDENRIHVIPYPIDARRYASLSDFDSRPPDRPLTVGFVGGIGLRKGAPYFVEVARRFKPSTVRFVMVGPVAAPKPIAAKISESVELVGRIPRGQISDWMLKFDLFLFPSTCEGAAGSVTEAMATGLPIITSPNSGTPVRDGVEGFICNYSDIDAMTARIEQLAVDVPLRREMGRQSRATALRMNLDDYGRRLTQLMRSGLSRPTAPQSAQTV